MKIYESPVKEEVWAANLMMGIVRTRLRFRRGALSDFVFGSYDGRTYEDADRCTLIVEMTKLM